jgi:hypothetical protein
VIRRQQRRTRIPGPLISQVSGVTDSFDRADSSTSLGSTDGGSLSPLAWTAQNGTWGIASNKAYLVSATSQAVATVDTGLADADVAFDVTMESGSNIGIVCRLIDNNNYLMCAWYFGTTLELYKNDGGSFISLGSVSQSWANGTTYRLRITAVGDQIKVYLDGVETLTHTLSGADQSKYGAATSHGLRSDSDGNARFDTFAVTPA